MEIGFLEKFGFYARLIFIAAIAAVLIGVLVYVKSPSVRILDET